MKCVVVRHPWLRLLLASLLIRFLVSLRSGLGFSQARLPPELHLWW